eukprot:6749242-Prymnesium_polylepis.1
MPPLLPQRCMAPRTAATRHSPSTRRRQSSSCWSMATRPPMPRRSPPTFRRTRARPSYARRDSNCAPGRNRRLDGVPRAARLELRALELGPLWRGKPRKKFGRRAAAPATSRRRSAAAHGAVCSPWTRATCL